MRVANEGTRSRRRPERRRTSGLGQHCQTPSTACASGTSTRPTSPSMVTAYVLRGSVAGPRSTAPVHTLNCAPCNGHVTVEPSSLPSLSGPCLCVHLDCVAKKRPLTLNTTTSPTSATDPGGTTLTRKSFFIVSPPSARRGVGSPPVVCDGHAARRLVT